MRTGEIAIRMLNEDDEMGLVRLAQRDSAQVPPAPVLGASVDGELRAALSLRDGASIADPFHPGDGLRALLHERAGQLNGRSRGLRERLRTRPRARGALPASPPGAGGRLLQI